MCVKLKQRTQCHCHHQTWAVTPAWHSVMKCLHHRVSGVTVTYLTQCHEVPTSNVSVVSLSRTWHSVMKCLHHRVSGVTYLAQCHEVPTSSCQWCHVLGTVSWSAYVIVSVVSRTLTADFHSLDEAGRVRSLSCGRWTRGWQSASEAPVPDIGYSATLTWVALHRPPAYCHIHTFHITHLN